MIKYKTERKKDKIIWNSVDSHKENSRLHFLIKWYIIASFSARKLHQKMENKYLFKLYAWKTLDITG